MSRKNNHKPNTFFRKHRLWLWGGVALCLYIFCFYYFFAAPAGFRWRALYGDENYPEGYEIQGIDISHYQGKIDWDKLKEGRIKQCPVRFVMIKATEGKSVVDSRFSENFFEAREHGFIRGAYHFYSVKSSARDQARHFVETVDLLSGDLPPVLDVEQKPDTMTDDEFRLEILTWLHYVEDKYNARPIIYTYYKFKEKYLSTPVFDGYPYWIAHYYVPEVTYQGEWKFWQHTDNGHLPGIHGDVDFDIYNGSFYDLQKLCIE